MTRCRKQLMASRMFFNIGGQLPLGKIVHGFGNLR
jgi:hypothetical protein